MVNNKPKVRIEESEEEQNSDGQYKILINSIDEGFCIIEMIFDKKGKAFDYKFLETNSVFEKQTGLIKPKGKLVSELVPNLEKHWFEIYGEIALSGEAKRFENGSEAMGRWFDVYATRVGGKESRKVGLIFNDITYRKKAEKVLSESEERFRTLIEKSTDAIQLVSPEGKILYTSESIVNVLGYTPEELLGQGIAPFMHHEDIEFFNSKFHELLNHPGKLVKLEYRVKHKNGSWAWIETTGVNHLETPNINALVGTFHNITERKSSEERQFFLSEATRIISSSLEYNEVLSNIAKMLVPRLADWYSVDLVDDENKIVNATVFHKDPEKVKWALEIQKQNPVDYEAQSGVPNVIRTGKSELYENITDEMLVAGAKNEEQLRLLREIGYKSIMIVPLNIRGQAIGVISLVATDSDRHYNQQDLKFAEELASRIATAIDNARLYSELENRVKERTSELEDLNTQLVRSNQELQDFAYVASHDLQEPLRKISSFSKLLESKHKDELSESAQTYLAGINRSSRRMSTLINDLLAFSRVTTKTQAFKEIDLNEITTEVLDDMQTRIEESNTKIDIAELCLIEGDPLQIRLLIQNIISNAIKYSKHGTSPEIKIYGQTSQDTCTIFIKDNGIGFDEIYLDRIFTIFQRLHGRSEYEGTGIGLAICKKIVERHGGTITANSKEGEGSTFIINLPLYVKE